MGADQARANVRNDGFGGTEENRMRFPIEVAQRIRAVWPDDKPLFMRLSCEVDAGWGPDEGARLALKLKSVGVDFISWGAFPQTTMIAANGGRYAEPMAEHAAMMALAAYKRLITEYRELAKG